MMIRNIIFDFDGTLVDSCEGVIKTFKKVTEELTSKQIEEKEITRLIGKPLNQIISILFATDNDIFIKKGSDLFKEYYEKEGVYQNIIYPGTKEMLESFKNQPYSLFIVSNKIESFLNKILKQHNIEEFFVSVTGTDGSDAQSRKAEQISNLLNFRKLKKNETIMVGDTENDIIVAKENNIYSVGVTWGYGSEDSLIKARTDVIFHTLKDLQKFIKEKSK